MGGGDDGNGGSVVMNRFCTYLALLVSVFSFALFITN